MPQPCFFDHKPKTLRYCSSLLTDPGAIVSEQNLDEFCAQYGFTFSSTPNLSSERLVKFFCNKWNKPHCVSNPQIASCLTQENTNNFIICKMSQGIGAGIFLAQDAKVIPMGSIVMLYAGALEVLPRNQNISSDYAMNFSLLLKMNICDILDEDSLEVRVHIDAEKIGNLSRFIQHAPLDVELKYMRDSNGIKAKITTANLIQGVDWHLGFPVIYLLAARDICPGEQLLLSYGKDYWSTFFGNNSRINPYLFDVHGNIIASATASNEIQILQGAVLENLVDAPRIHMTLEEIHKTFRSIPGDRPTNQRKDFYDTVTFAIKNFITTLNDDDQSTKNLLQTFITDFTQEYQNPSNIWYQGHEPDNSVLESLIWAFFRDKKSNATINPLETYLAHIILNTPLPNPTNSYGKLSC